MWKSVKKGLPEKSGYYLVCHRSNLPFTAGFNVWGNQNFTVVGGGEDAEICDITNWMEIPPNSQEDLEESPSTSTNNDSQTCLCEIVPISDEENLYWDAKIKFNEKCPIHGKK